MREITAVSPDAWTKIDLTLTQLRALFVLATRHPTRVGDLASALGMSLGSASALSARLVRLGYVTRHRPPEDQRTVLLVLSPKATRMLDRLERRSTAQLSLAIGRMTEAERVALTMALRAFLRLAPKKAAQRASSTRAKRSA